MKASKLRTNRIFRVETFFLPGSQLSAYDAQRLAQYGSNYPSLLQPQHSSTTGKGLASPILGGGAAGVGVGIGTGGKGKGGNLLGGVELESSDEDEDESESD